MPSLVVNGSIFEHNGAIGFLSWTSISAVEASDNARASVSDMLAGDITRYIMVRGFDFSQITADENSIINGFKVRVEGQYTGFLSGDVVDWSVRLTKDAAIPVGDDKATQTSLAHINDAYVEYGGASDKWGLTWTLADLIDGLGVLFSAKCTSASDVQTVLIDHIELTVYYTVPTKMFPFWFFKM